MSASLRGRLCSVWRKAVRCIAGADWQADVAPLLKNHRLTHIEHRWALQIALVTCRCMYLKISPSDPLQETKLSQIIHTKLEEAVTPSAHFVLPPVLAHSLSLTEPPFFGTICHQAFNKHPPLHLLSPTI